MSKTKRNKAKPGKENIAEVKQKREVDINRGITISQYMAERGVEGGVQLWDADKEGSPTPASMLETEGGKKYTVGDLVAKGGMGAILDAKDLNIRRQVAMKVMLSDKEADNAQILRFIEEAQITGQLEHPNIVPVHELGVDASANVFYTMKFVKGVTLEKVLTDIREGNEEIVAQFPLSRLLTIFLKICDAIAFAHSKGVIHRDLKPENIMLGGYGEVQVLDWGLAKIVASKAQGTESRDPERTIQAPDWLTEDIESIRRDIQNLKTVAGKMMGTPSYMAPEQVSGKVSEIGPRADIYALGGILYSILALHPPVIGSGVSEILERVAQGTIWPPNYWNPRRRHEVGGNKTGLLRHCPGGRIPGSLAAVAMKALSRSPQDRYRSVQNLQTDVEAWQRGFATSAEKAGRWRQFALLVGRHQKETGLIAVALLVCLILILGALIGVNSEKNKAKDNEQLALLAKQKAKTNEQRALRAEAKTNTLLLRVRKERDKVRTALKKLRTARAGESAAKAKLAEHKGYANYAQTIALVKKKLGARQHRAAEKMLWAMDKTYRGWEWGRLLHLCRMKWPTLKGHSGTVTSAAFSPDGTRVITGSWDNTAKIWNARIGLELITLKGHSSGISSVAFSPDGARVITGSWDNTAKIWNATTGRMRRTLKGHSAPVSSVAFSPDGTRVATGSSDDTAKLWDAETGAELRTFKGHSSLVSSVAFSPDGARVLTGNWDHTARIWNAKTGATLRTLKSRSGWIYAAAFSPDGRHVVTADYNETATIWDSRSGKRRRILKGHASRVTAVAFSPDGARVLTGSDDKTARIWNARTGRVLRTFKGYRRGVSFVAFSPDGSRMVTSGADHTAMILDARALRSFVSLKDLNSAGAHSETVTSVAFSPDGTRVITGSYDKTAKIWYAKTGKRLGVLEGHSGTVTSVAFSAGGNRVATASNDQTAKIWDAKTGKRLQTLDGHSAAVASVAFSPNGTRVATASHDKTVKLWNTQTGQILRTFKGHSWPVYSVAFSPDGARVLTGSWDKSVKIWNVNTGYALMTLRGHSRAVCAAVFSPDGLSIATAGSDGTVRIWHALEWTKSPAESKKEKPWY